MGMLVDLASEIWKKNKKQVIDVKKLRGILATNGGRKKSDPCQKSLINWNHLVGVFGFQIVPQQVLAAKTFKVPARSHRILFATTLVLDDIVSELAKAQRLLCPWPFRATLLLKVLISTESSLLDDDSRKCVIHRCFWTSICLTGFLPFSCPFSSPLGISYQPQLVIFCSEISEAF